MAVNPDVFLICSGIVSILFLPSPNKDASLVAVDAGYLPTARGALRVFLTSNDQTIITRAGSPVALTYEEIEALAKLEEDELAIK